MTKPKIAILGLGIMGRGIALNYLKAGYQINVWNRSIEKTKELEALGANVASSPAVAAKDADIVFDVTANDESSRFVTTDQNDGVLSVMSNSQKLITCATLTIDWTLELGDLCKEKDITFFDMPMTGSRPGAESGSLLLLVGGDEKKFSEIKKHLQPISNEQKYFGEVGSGMKYKLILNALQAAHVIAFGESLRQAKAAGIDLEATGDALSLKPGGLATELAWSLYKNPPEQTNFSVKWMLKDVICAKQMIENSNYDSPIDSSVLDVAIKTLQNAYDQGLGDEDYTIVNRL